MQPTSPEAIEKFVRTNGPLRMPAEICNVPEIAALRATNNPTRNDLVRQIVGTLTTQDNVFSVWTVGQAIQKRRGNTQYGDFEAGDNVLAEVRLHFDCRTLSRSRRRWRLWKQRQPGPDGVTGTYDDPMDAEQSSLPATLSLSRSSLRRDPLMKPFSLLELLPALLLSTAFMRRNTRRAQRIGPKWKPSGLALFLLFLDWNASRTTACWLSSVSMATSKAAASGTFLGTRPVIPPGDEQGGIGDNRYNGRPFSLASAVMTDEQTSKNILSCRLLPRRVKDISRANSPTVCVPDKDETLTMQFAAPPAPLPVEGEKSAKQTVSFLLPSAKGPIANVSVPAPSPDQ